MDKVGIIAGAGEFPILLARQCVSQGVEPVVVALKEEADPLIAEDAPNTHWEEMGKIGRILKHFKAQGVKEAIMAGKVHKTRIFKDFRPDIKALALLWALRDRKDDTILGKAADVLADEGITLLPQTTFMESYLPSAGLLSKRAPTGEENCSVQICSSI